MGHRVKAPHLMLGKQVCGECPGEGAAQRNSQEALWREH